VSFFFLLCQTIFSLVLDIRKKKKVFYSKAGTGTGCPEGWWMPCPWRHSRSGWRGLWATESWCWSLQGCWTRWPLRVPSNSNVYDSMIVLTHLMNISGGRTVTVNQLPILFWTIWISVGAVELSVLMFLLCLVPNNMEWFLEGGLVF